MFFLFPCTVEEFLGTIKDIKSKNSSGHDEISNKLVRNISNAIAQPMTTLINKSFITGFVPNSIKIAKIIPIYKSKEKFLFNNYRPISLLHALSKIIEKLVHQRLYSFLVKYDILNKNQFGFRPNHSTIDTVLKLMQELF